MLPADYTFTANDKGSHIFTSAVTLVTSGSQTLTATDKAASSITGKATVTVNAAAASTLTLSAPAGSSQNSAFSVTLTAQDAYGNIAGGYTGTVHFTTSDKGSTVVLPGDYTFISSDQGSHTFTNGVTLATVGNQTVTATDKANSSLASTATVSVQAPQAATHLSISAPSSSTAGTAFSITVTALDGNNNTVTSYTGTIHFTTSDNGKSVVLPADYTFTANDKGSHTFTSAVTLVTSGSQTITATDKASSSIKGSATVTVNPAAAVSLSVTGFPSPAPLRPMRTSP